MTLCVYERERQRQTDRQTEEKGRTVSFHVIGFLQRGELQMGGGTVLYKVDDDDEDDYDDDDDEEEGYSGDEDD